MPEMDVATPPSSAAPSPAGSQAPAHPATAPPSGSQPATAPETAVPAELPAEPLATAPSAAAPVAPAGSGLVGASGLRRRVPQTHLVEQLRTTAGSAEAEATGHDSRAVRDAANALTRYQAARTTASRDNLR
jgi:hypothetical protein